MKLSRRSDIIKDRFKASTYQALMHNMDSLFLEKLRGGTLRIQYAYDIQGIIYFENRDVQTSG